MTRYAVIEFVPGYLPENDDPFVTDDYAEACQYLRIEGQSWLENDDVIRVEQESVDAYRVIRTGHLLDVVGEVVTLEEEDE